MQQTSVMERPRTWKAMLLPALFLVAAAIGRSDAMDVTHCGQDVRDRDVGVLVGDLTCTASLGSFAVRLGNNATLDLAGHTISGDGVFCPRSCTILGPGDITGAYSAVYASGYGKMTLAGGLSLHDNIIGVSDGGARLTLVDVDVSNNSEHGFLVLSRSVVGTNVVVTDNGGFGLFAQQARVRIDGLTATGNAVFGVEGKRVKLFNSTVTGNEGGAPSNPPFVDVVSTRRPRLVATTCDHSLGPDGIDWDVCSGD